MWSWDGHGSLSQPSRPTSADPSLVAPAAVLLQMKLPASLLGPYSMCLRRLGGGGCRRLCRRRGLRLRRHLRSPGGRRRRRDHAVGGGQLRPLDSVRSVAGECQSLTAPQQHHLTAPDSTGPTSDSTTAAAA